MLAPVVAVVFARRSRTTLMVAGLAIFVVGVVIAAATVLPLVATFLIVAGLNVGYIFSSEVTGYTGTVLAVLLLTYGVLGIVGNSVSVIAFAVWGLSGFSSLIPLQHRLLTVDARVASVAVSWYSTAMYLGIAAASSDGLGARRREKSRGRARRRTTSLTAP